MFAPALKPNNQERRRAFYQLRTSRIVGALSVATLPQSVLADNPPRRDEWDKQIERDVKAGKLDSLIKEARQDHRQDDTEPLP